MTLKSIIGLPVASDTNKFIRRERFHQAWWRACVLDLPQGAIGKGEQPVCSRIPMPPSPEIQDDDANFLATAAAAAARRTLAERAEEAAGQRRSAGIVDVQRLRSNLLSSQPLAFNFFGPPAEAENLVLANKFLPQLLSIDGARITKIEFEYAPDAPIGDNTAFDVAVKYERDGRKGLVGIECKYTETFSPETYDRASYRTLFEKTRSLWNSEYTQLVQSDVNQLFRTQLLAHALVQRGDFDEARVCLFSSANDSVCSDIGGRFASLLSPEAASRFIIRTFDDFIEQAQLTSLSRDEREWTMRLWARYCAQFLSSKVAGAQRP